MTPADDDREEHDAPPADRPLPEPPDLARVAELRRRLRQDRREHSPKIPGLDVPGMRTPEEAGRRVRDIGVYTIIPMMMFVGPAIGYLVGLAVEKVLGGKPWPSLLGILWGLAAAFRQIYLILKRRAEKPDGRD
jgi:hypothetical protein